MVFSPKGSVLKKYKMNENRNMLYYKKYLTRKESSGVLHFF
jgi:hypothetical protein